MSGQDFTSVYGAKNNFASTNTPPDVIPEYKELKNYYETDPLGLKPIYITPTFGGNGYQVCKITFLKQNCLLKLFNLNTAYPYPYQCPCQDNAFCMKYFGIILHAKLKMAFGTSGKHR